MQIYILAFAMRLALIALAYFVTRALPVYYRAPMGLRCGLFIAMTALFLLPLEALFYALTL